MRLLNFVSDLIVRYRQRKWRRYIKRNRVYAPDGAIRGPRLRLESGKYLRSGRDF
jgi:hypothetical protein